MARKPSYFRLPAIISLFIVIQLGSTFNLAFEPRKTPLPGIRFNASSETPPKTLASIVFQKFGPERFLISKNSTVSKPRVVVSGNSTIRSANRTFELGFFTVDGGSSWYLGIWYAAVTIRTYVWVANRNDPVFHVGSATVELTASGRLRIVDVGNRTVWETENEEKVAGAKLLESGNLVLRTAERVTVWQSFDFPSDTWLPGMAIRCGRATITCWRSASDPSPGNYALRLRPPECGEFELVHTGTGRSYWSTGNWNGASFTGVPEMTVPYIYSFRFDNPSTPLATFIYTEKYLPAVYGQRPLLTRFVVDSAGQLKQFTWSPQTVHWDMFWSRPENPCRVYGLCGKLGFCRAGSGGGIGIQNLVPCGCLAGFQPENISTWRSGDFAEGCRRTDGSSCSPDDGFVNFGTVVFDGDAVSMSVPGSSGRSFCEEACLKNCSCFGLGYNPQTGFCKNWYGNAMNFRNLTSSSTEVEVFYLRVGKGGLKKKKRWRKAVLIGATCSAGVMGLALLVLFLAIRKRRKRRQKEEEEGIFPVTNLKVFSFKELQAATGGFSEKLGHGGFGAVFRGQLADSSPVAVKRLERPGGGEREFRAEVCTIGNIQHVNLVRLRGFCSENSHRLLVYDYMENGPLSVFLRRDGPSLSWDVRFRVAVGTARGIAYLHEECRDCIIHCDIKPENILLDGEFAPKVSDFGLAKLVGRDFSRVMTTMRGTWGYVAPEWISGVAITAKADVYSYGMTLLEIIGGRRNVEAPLVQASGGGEGGGAPAGEKWFFPPWAAKQIIEGNVANVIDPRLGTEYNQAEVERAALVAIWCIQDEEGARPTMGVVVKMLEGTVEVVVPPTPQLLQALVAGDSFPEGGIASGQRPSSKSGFHTDDGMSEVGSVGSSGGQNRPH